MNRKDRSRLASCVFSLAVVVLLSSGASAEWKEKVLYSFQGGSDGSLPAGGVVYGSDGNLYGVTTDGGTACPAPGCGTIFQLAPPATKGGAWTETVLHVFDGNDGSRPAGSVILDAKGNLYGTTAYGGTGTCLLLGGNVGCGLIYELSPPAQKGGQWSYSILYSFLGGKDGQYPTGNLVFDAVGNLYGATIYGGGFGTCNAPYYLYCGTVFKLSSSAKKDGKWKEKVLHAFKSGSDGANPNGGLVFDSKGTIYGTTFAGGNQNCKTDSSLGCGTAFRLKPPSKKSGTWAEKQLHIFTASDDGRLPSYGVILDAKGAVYGAAEGGAEIGGVVFRLSAVGGGGWREATVYGFSSESYSYTPAVAFFDKNGHLYGTTNVGPGHSLAGSVFRLTPPERNGGSWGFNLLYGFNGGSDGALPNAGVIPDKSGNLYGTTTEGGTGTSCGFQNCGTAFEVSP
jgi:uncharacterized repeat protein (TIGR03803 family)